MLCHTYNFEKIQISVHMCHKLAGVTSWMEYLLLCSLKRVRMEIFLKINLSYETKELGVKSF